MERRLRTSEGFVAGVAAMTVATAVFGLVRAVDGRGDLQTASQAPPHPSGASGYHEVDVIAEST